MLDRAGLCTERERERDRDRERRQREGEKGGGESEKERERYDKDFFSLKDGSEDIKDGIKRCTRRWREKVDL